jgi:hypothetical protein
MSLQISHNLNYNIEVQTTGKLILSLYLASPSKLSSGEKPQSWTQMGILK